METYEFDPTDLAAAVASGEPLLDCSDAAEPPFDGYRVEIALSGSDNARPYAFVLNAPCAIDPSPGALRALGPGGDGGGKELVAWVVEAPQPDRPFHNLVLLLVPKEAKAGGVVERLVDALFRVQAALGAAP